MTDLTADELRTSWPDAHLFELLDSAQTHLLNEEPAQAIAVWKQMIREGGAGADWAHLEYADFLFQKGLDDEARSELADLMAGRQVFSQPWRLAAELLEDLGYLEEALSWYSVAVGCLSDDQLRFDNGPVWAREVRVGRRRLRWKTKIPLDDADLLAGMGDAETDDKWLRLFDLFATPAVIEGRLQFWARHELEAGAAEAAIPNEELIIAGYFQRVEGTLQAHGGRVVLLPRSPKDLRSVVSVFFDARHLTEIPSLLSRYEDGNAVEWPPGRNRPCWCDSGIKYKKCCAARVAVA